MRPSSTIASVTLHAAVAIALLHASTEARPSGKPPVVILPPFWPDPPAASRSSEALPGAPQPVIDPLTLPSPPSLPLPENPWGPREMVNDKGRILAGDSRPSDPRAGRGPLDAALVEVLPVLLVGPNPAYPELLRQAGLEGRVVLEAVVDTTGRVEPGSIVVVATTHPDFAAAAARALAGSLFRPARLHGQAVRVRIRVPVDFRLRSGRFPG